MKFKEINLSSFGKFEDKEIRFSDGINVIYGKNEAGKSTLSAALRFVLYGFSSQKTRSVETNDKLKYTSWKTGNAVASAVVESADTTYRIERTASSKNTLKVTDSFGRECNFGKEPGEAMLGVDETAFVKMSCIRQNEVSSEATEGLSDLVQNIVYSADESIDITKAEKKLTDYRNVFRSLHRKTGKCYELEEKISSLRYALGEASEAHKTLLGAEAKLLEIKKRIKYNESQIENMRAEILNAEGYEAAQIIEKVLAAKNALDEAKTEHDKALADLAKDGKICGESTLSEIISCFDAVKRSESELHNAKAAYENVKKNGNSIEARFPDFKVKSLPFIKEKYLSSAKTVKILSVIASIFAVICVVCSVLGFLKILPFTPAIAIAAGLLLTSAVLFIVGIVGFSKSKILLEDSGFDSFEELIEFENEYDLARENLLADSAKERILADSLENKTETYEACKMKLASVMASAGIKETDAQKAIETLKNALLRYNDAKTNLKKCESVYDAFLSTNDMHALSDAAKHFTHTPEKEKRLLIRDMEFIAKANEQLAEKEKELIKQASYNASAIRKPSEILAEKEATEELLARATECADAADLALATLKSACDDLKNGISPEIKRRASRYFNLFTDGKYDGLEVSAEFGLGIIEGGILREAAFLSRGTKDVAYLSLRVALCEVLFKEKPALILDETFAYIDDERIKAVLSVLEKLSNEYQIFIFTCHEREKVLLSKLSGATVTEL